MFFVLSVGDFCTSFKTSCSHSLGITNHTVILFVDANPSVMYHHKMSCKCDFMFFGLFISHDDFGTLLRSSWNYFIYSYFSNHDTYCFCYMFEIFFVLDIKLFSWFQYMFFNWFCCNFFVMIHQFYPFTTVILMMIDNSTTYHQVKLDEQVTFYGWCVSVGDFGTLLKASCKHLIMNQ